MSRVRVYITPLESENTYGDEIEVTNYVLSENLSSFTRSLDNNEYDFGIYRISSGKLKLRNESGKFGATGEDDSIFTFSRADALVRVTWDRASYDSYGGVGLLPHQVWPSDERDLFIGLISEEDLKTTLTDASIEFTVKGRESLFDRVLSVAPDYRTEWTNAGVVTTQSWRSITYSPDLNLFAVLVQVSVGVFSVFTSPDAITWTQRTTSNNVDWSSSINGICWSPSVGLFVAVGFGGGCVQTSSNGTTWTERTASVTSHSWKSVIWVETLGLFVAVGGPAVLADGTDRVMTSPDGINWTTRTTPNESSDWFDVTWSEELELLVAVSNDDNTSDPKRIMYSSDAITWTSIEGPISVDGVFVEFNSVDWSPELGLFIAVGNSTTVKMAKSEDGIDWEVVDDDIVNAQNLFDVIWSPELNLFVATRPTNANVVVSSDGEEWFANPLPTNGKTFITWSSELGLLVATGGSPSTEHVSYSLGGAFVSDFIKGSLNQAKLTSVMDYDEASIVPGFDVQVDDLSFYENKTVKELLQDLLFVSNSVLVIDGDTMVVRSRDPDADIVKTFYGEASTEGRENIVMIDNQKEGSNRLFNYFTWSDTDLVELDSDSIDTYGVRKKEISVDSILSLYTKENVLEELLAEFGDPKDELDLTAPLDYEGLEAGLLGRVNIDYPLVTINGIDKSKFVRTTSQHYKVIQVKVDTKKDLIKFTLRRV